MNDRRNTGQGFSLIELMVVVAIIAALAAILIPVVSKGKARAARIGCIHNLKQMAGALQMYRDDWNGVMPYRMGYEPYSENVGWTARLRTYNDTVDLFRCPADFHFFSYGMNVHAMSRAAPPEGYDVDDPFKQSDVACPTKLIIIYEAPGSGGRQAGGGGDVEAGDADLTNEGQVDGHVYGCGQTKQEVSHWENILINDPNILSHCFHLLHFPGRHNGGNNLLFWDGHAQWFRDWPVDPTTGKSLITFDPSRPPSDFL